MVPLLTNSVGQNIPLSHKLGREWESEQLSERNAARAKRTVQSKQTSEWCEGTIEWTSECCCHLNVQQYVLRLTCWIPSYLCFLPKINMKMGIGHGQCVFGVRFPSFQHICDHWKSATEHVEDFYGANLREIIPRGECTHIKIGGFRVVTESGSPCLTGRWDKLLSILLMGLLHPIFCMKLIRAARKIVRHVRLHCILRTGMTLWKESFGNVTECFLKRFQGTEGRREIRRAFQPSFPLVIPQLIFIIEQRYFAYL